jgi:hypothetical protein
MRIFLLSGQILDYVYKIVFGSDIVEVSFINKPNMIINIKDIETITR